LVDGVHAQLVDLGERYVKHLLEPVRVFAAHAPGSTGAAAHRVPFPSADDLRPVVAVVPFVAMPADATHDALGHAMADEVIATLARHGGLRVLSRVTTAALRGTDLDLPSLRKLLGASYLLTGRFYAQADRVRLSVEPRRLDTARGQQREPACDGQRAHACAQPAHGHLGVVHPFFGRDGADA
jgi:adenylate cyclase